MNDLLKLFENKLPFRDEKHHERLDWSAISEHPNITCEFIKKYPNLPWDWCSFSKNPNITCEIIQNNLDKNWNWYEISKHLNITWECIQMNSIMNFNRRDNPNWNVRGIIEYCKQI